MFKKKGLASPGEVAVSQVTSNLEFQSAEHVGLACQITVSAPAAKTFNDGATSVSGDQITISSHGYKAGLRGQLTTSGTLPGGLALSTDYYVIINDGNTIQLATTAANASNSVAINITSAAGGGTHTFTPTALSATLYLQGSVDDGTNWFTLDSVAVTATGVFKLVYANTPFNYVRGSLSVAAGQMTVGDIYFALNDAC